MSIHLRSPLANTNKTNTDLSPYKDKKGSSDLDQLAWELKIAELSPKKNAFRPTFETESAIISSFKSPNSRRSPFVSGLDHTDKSASSPIKADKSAGYEYLCRVQAIKQWLETVLQIEIKQSPLELISYIRNGIYLAMLANKYLPSKRSIYTNDSKLDFRHTENINSFFRLLKYLDVPQLFFFELTDLFDGKDIPKVWYCLHALSYKIHMVSPESALIQNLVGAVEFLASDVATANRILMGRQLPGFSSIDISCFSSPVKNSFMNKALNLHSPTKPSLTPIPKADDTLKFDTKKWNLNFDKDSNSIDTPSKPSNQKVARKLFDEYSSLPSQNITVKPQSTSLQTHSSDVVYLQALSRGSLLRYKMFVDKIMLRSFAPELEQFVSIVRGYLARKRTVHKHRGDVELFKTDIIYLQAIARGVLLRSSSRFDDNSLRMNQFKAIIRGQNLRHEVGKIAAVCKAEEKQIVLLQSIIRRKTKERLVSLTLNNIDIVNLMAISLQSLARGVISRRGTNCFKAFDHDQAPLIFLQAISRGALARNRVRNILRQSYHSFREIVDFQAVARGAILRTKLCNSVLVSLIDEDPKMNLLFAKVRGNNARKEYNQTQVELLQSTDSFIKVQAQFRGVLLRFIVEERLEYLYNPDCIFSIMSLQSAIRASKVRRSVRAMTDYYHENEEKVRIAQRLLQRAFARNAYKSLVNTKNPPISVIRRFSHLLFNQNFDLAEDLRLNQAKDQMIDLCKQNEDLEHQIDNLDIKLGLLDKNLISADEFVKQEPKFSVIKPVSKAVSTPYKTASLTNSSKQRLEIYQSLFYILQTNPIYFSRYLKSMRLHDEDLSSDFVNLIMCLFPSRNDAKSESVREEYYFVKFICAVMKVDFTFCSHNIADITKIKCSYWIKFFLKYNNHTKNRKLLVGIFGKLLKLLWEDNEVSFESDPSVIYSQIRERELKVHGSSEKHEKIVASDAIAEDDVSDKFVQNLMQLRDATSDFLGLFQSSIPNMPNFVRLIAKNVYNSSRMNFPEHPEQMHLSVAGVVVVKHYISTVLHSPQLYGFQKNSHESSFGSENFIHLSRVLLQMFSMKPFKDNFLKPLNDFVVSHQNTIKMIIREIIDINDADTVYAVNDFKDLVSTEKPMLKFSVRDMITIDRTVTDNLSIFAPNLDDLLHEVVARLNEVLNSTKDFVQLAELGEYPLTLVPASNVDTIDESKKKMLLSQAKYYLLFLISAQDGDNLLEMLIQGITPSHEKRFEAIWASEAETRIQVNSLLDNGPLASVPAEMTLSELKQKLLQILIQLENMGEISRRNSYQDLINLLVLDMKTRNLQREFTKNQLHFANDTIAKLQKKNKALEKQLSDYNSHIDSMLESLQLRPKEKKFLNIIPVFSKQYFYYRQLKKNNCLPKFGSYKISAKKLLDQTVITKISPEFYKKVAGSTKLEFKFSCHKVGIFTLEAAVSSVNIPGACQIVTLDNILDRQQEKIKDWPLFDKMVTFHTDNLATMIFKHFYEVGLK
ncbi:hypothetical protein PUMCH_000782 [Australozyma saopauloensis]|uniref:Ras GTPase-activating-like protein IQG1 n=1 Tax=Australozyma saopauloensis TaxID=291208 RepID=A0AAX4H5N6_9ASCO|nr:hypothetical protein PUMCH_000782 [[Candida] saopauloensis]